VDPEPVATDHRLNHLTTQPLRVAHVKERYEDVAEEVCEVAILFAFRLVLLLDFKTYNHHGPSN
jgi:hypothetical protein